MRDGTTLRAVPDATWASDASRDVLRPVATAVTFPAQIARRVHHSRQAELVDRIGALIDAYARMHGDLLEVV